VTKDNSGEKEEQKILDARRVLEPQEVKQGVIPGWLSKRLRAYWKRRGLDSPGCCQASLHNAVYDIARQAGIDDNLEALLDHWGTSKGGPYVCCNKAGRCFVSEPYGFGWTKARMLEAFCQALDLEWHASSNTWWNPGATIRITIHEKAKP